MQNTRSGSIWQTEIQGDGTGSSSFWSLASTIIAFLVKISIAFDTTVMRTPPGGGKGRFSIQQHTSLI
jgi:hypothetical protein